MSDPHSDVKLIDEEGVRLDGRALDELRPIRIEAGVLERADGSCYLEWGSNKVLVGVYGPREVHPKHMQNPLKGIVQARYNMASFSVSERKRPGPDRRAVEISKIISEALECVVLTDQFPRTTVDVYIEVIEASAGTRCAGLTAASVALADAGIPMKDLVVSIASGKINGKLALDLGKAEDNFGQADVPFAMVPRTGEVVLLQMDGHLTIKEFDKILDMNVRAATQVYELQKQALVKRYSAYAESAPGEEQAAHPVPAVVESGDPEHFHEPKIAAPAPIDAVVDEILGEVEKATPAVPGEEPEVNADEDEAEGGE
jgi:exosome complex component RRP41